MTRAQRDYVAYKPVSDVFTALSAIACVVALIGLIALFLSSKDNFGDANLFMPSGTSASLK